MCVAGAGPGAEPVESSFSCGKSDRGAGRSLEVYSCLAIVDAQREYDHVIGKFPV